MTIDLGSVIQANEFIELKDKDQQGFFVNRYDSLHAKDLRNISKSNINGVIAVTTGLKYFRIRTYYQYGLTNMPNKLIKELNSKEINLK